MSVLSGLVRAVKELASQGRLSCRLEETAYDDEIGEMARAIEELEEALCRKQTELAHAVSEYQILFDHVPCSISVQDREYRLLRWNKQFAVRFAPELGKTCYEIYKGRLSPCPGCSVMRTWEKGEHQCKQESRLNADGTRDYWFVQTIPMRNDSGEITSVMEMSIDMTLIRTLEEQLLQSEHAHKAIFESIPNAVFILDVKTLEILDCNQAAVKLYKALRKTLIGASILDLFPPEEREQYDSQLRAFTAFAGVIMQRPDGSTIHVDIRSSLARIESRQVLILCATDVTERLEIEQKLIQAGKMATLGEMAAGVAHELNQPLTVIRGVSSYFLRRLQRGEAISPDEALELAGDVKEQVDRASDIINHMRAFGRKSDVPLQDVSLNDSVRHACDLFGRQLAVHGIDLRLELDPHVHLIRAIPNRVEQMVVNLVLNARDAVDEKSEACPGSGAKYILLETREANNMVILAVEDSGNGVPDCLLHKIFEPFFTTKPVGKGTGLGLSIVYGLAKDFGGTLSVSNVPGGGARFELAFPAGEPAMEEPAGRLS